MGNISRQHNNDATLKEKKERVLDDAMKDIKSFQPINVVAVTKDIQVYAAMKESENSLIKEASNPAVPKESVVIEIPIKKAFQNAHLEKVVEKDAHLVTQMDVDSSLSGKNMFEKDMQSLIRETMQKEVGDLKTILRNDIQNIHLEVLKQFHMQRGWIESSLKEVLPMERLEKEIQELREENQRLKTRLGEK